MPKIKMDYSNTIIYKLVCNDLNITDCYIGHTTNFKERKRHHKDNCNKENRKEYYYNVYKFIRENGGWDNWSMIEIEKFPCVDGNEARKRERFWFEELKATLNGNVPSRTKTEYYKENFEKIALQKKQYQKENAEHIKEYQKENAEHIKEYQKIYNENNNKKLKQQSKNYKFNNKDAIREQMKKYYENNKEKLKQKSINYYQANKEKILQQKKEKREEKVV